MNWDIAVELGESTVRMATRDAGLTFTAPSLGAFRGDRLIAIGDEALEMLGRAPDDVTIARPVENGVISDARLVGQWLTLLLEPFVGGARVIRPSVVCLQSGFARQSEREAISHTLGEMGVGRCAFLDSDIAAAAGAGCDVKKPDGFAVAEIGAGHMSVSLLSGGHIVRRRLIPFGMRRINEDIIQLVRASAAMRIGPRTAEEVKLVLASALPAREVTSVISGLDMVTGFPGEREISAFLVREAVEPIVDALAIAVNQAVQDAPEELAADILDTGVMLTGGGALLSGLDKVISSRCALSAHLPETPALCAAKGVARILQDPIASDTVITPWN